MNYYYSSNYILENHYKDYNSLFLISFIIYFLNEN